MNQVRIGELEELAQNKKQLRSSIDLLDLNISDRKLYVLSATCSYVEHGGWIEVIALHLHAEHRVRVATQIIDRSEYNV